MGIFRLPSLAVTASAIALGAVVAVTAPVPGFNSDAVAQQGSGQGSQGQGGQGQGGQGSQGQGQGGPSADSEGQGPRAGQGGNTGGGQPPWASEGIPEDIELGRLSVARSPDRVLDRAYDEVLLTMEATADFYNLSLDDMISQMSLNWDGITIVDSPLQNLALYRDALDGTIDLSAYGITNDRETLMAVFLGVASDKEEPITTGTVLALSVIFDMPLTGIDPAALAAEAEAIRIAVLAGHG